MKQRSEEILSKLKEDKWWFDTMQGVLLDGLNVLDVLEKGTDNAKIRIIQ